jgi:hypothetical protein
MSLETRTPALAAASTTASIAAMTESGRLAGSFSSMRRTGSSISGGSTLSTDDIRGGAPLTCRLSSSTASPDSKGSLSVRTRWRRIPRE